MSDRVPSICWSCWSSATDAWSPRTNCSRAYGRKRSSKRTRCKRTCPRCGKTRLAMQVAGHLPGSYSDGIWLVELAALTNPGLVPQAVADVLGLKEHPGEILTRTIGDYLASRQLLLVLDDAEHLLAACAEFIDAELRRCAQLVILVTSRERLGVAGELT